MNNNCLTNIRGYFSYKTNCFESFSELINVKNDKNKNYVNLLSCNIRSMNYNFDQLILYLENYINNKKMI